MMRNGRFVKLQWDELEKEHQNYWDTLQERYNLCIKKINSSASFDDLAKQCVQMCYDYLFFLEEWDITHEKLVDLPWETNVKCTKNEYREYFANYITPALCDHLIVTFAYRFFCDNLEPLDKKECLKRGFGCTCQFTQDSVNTAPDRLERNEMQHDFFKVNGKILDKYKDSLLSITNSYKVQLQNCELDFDNKLTDLLQERTLADQFLAPNWLFTLTMARGWKNSPYKAKKKITNGLVGLTKFANNNTWLPLLLRTQDKSKRNMHHLYEPYYHNLGEKEAAEAEARKTCSALELRIDDAHDPYVAIAFPPGYLQASKEPISQTYFFKNTKGKIEIPKELQYVFNNYLLERNFHWFALATSLDLLLKNSPDTFWYKDWQYARLLQIVRLRAPLAHTALIRIMEPNFWKLQDNMDIAWINGYINKLNSIALPILEELFLLGVYHSFDFEEIPSQIYNSFQAKDALDRCRYDRLNLYRLIPQKDKGNHCENLNSDFLKSAEKLVDSAYLSGIGAEFRIPSFERYTYNLGACTAFD